jgi:AraC-like DNA-binding protein
MDIDIPPPAGPLAAAAEPHTADDFETRSITIPASLRPYVKVLMAVQVGDVPRLPLSVTPHDALMLTVQMGDGADCVLEAKGEPGQNTHVTGIRQWTGSFLAAGRCVSLFAMLTPVGSVQLFESQPLAVVPRIRAPLAGLLDRGLTRRLESDVALAVSLDAKLQAFASWLETRVAAQRRLTPAALRAARAAMRVCAEPGTAIDGLAGEAHISRRQLERDFAHWIGTTPRHLAQVARVQAVSRKGHAGASLADIAFDVGFADQPHMTRVVRQITGLPPGRLIRAARSPLGRAFRAASQGGTVYL